MVEPPQKLVVVKSSITGIDWKDAYKQRLMELVNNVNSIVTHTYFFLKFIFVNELEDDNTNNVFNLEDLINEDFFKEVFMSLLSQDGMNTIRSFIGCYSGDYKFEKGSIFYDCKANPVKHLRIYYQIAKTCEYLQGGKFINCFPIRTTFIPCYTTIDTLILNTQILKNKVLAHLDKQVVWNGAINFNSEGMEPQGPAKQIKFKRITYTDRVGVSILKQNFEPERRGGNKRVETKPRKFRKLRNRFKPDEVVAAELSLSYHRAASVNKENFVKYLMGESTAILKLNLSNLYRV
ncbi:hypothetical protein MFLAVUS_007858 [Mucor flavus]|uniref:Uncharacterized protein n=1 Tax=Mucor flavus TaxID=439312 RepID=A0ABP9Z5J5_9FUNG